MLAQDVPMKIPEALNATRRERQISSQRGLDSGHACLNRALVDTSFSPFADCCGVRRVDVCRLPCDVLPQIIHPVEEFVMDKDLPDEAWKMIWREMAACHALAKHPILIHTCRGIRF
ncbi:hypothetical protein U9M48_033987 [Paspalum notatum var. saurae]|uniref:Uncharacterized protein n=1 Tax=Paspalum notatum var. saurae TaxID=547442 RepID=A0AAQ3U9L7_PASNO